MTPQELAQVPVLQVLHRHEVRLLGRAHPENAGNVGILEDREETDLADKLCSGNKEKGEIRKSDEMLKNGLGKYDYFKSDIKIPWQLIFHGLA